MFTFVFLVVVMPMASQNVLVLKNSRQQPRSSGKPWCKANDIRVFRNRFERKLEHVVLNFLRLVHVPHPEKYGARGTWKLEAREHENVKQLSPKSDSDPLVFSGEVRSSMVTSFNLLWTGTSDHAPEGRSNYTLTSAPILPSGSNQLRSPSMTARPSPPKRSRPLRRPDGGGTTVCHPLLAGQSPLCRTAPLPREDAGSPDRTSAQSGALPYSRELATDHTSTKMTTFRNARAMRVSRISRCSVLLGTWVKPSGTAANGANHRAPPKVLPKAEWRTMRWKTSIQARNLTALMRAKAYSYIAVERFTNLQISRVSCPASTS